MEASMVDKKLSDKPCYFELSIGNAGNSLDGHNESSCNNLNDDDELETVDTTSYNSMTSSCKPTTHDKAHYYLPYWDYKPCMDVRCYFPDLRRRMYNSNMISKLTDKMVNNIFLLCTYFHFTKKKSYHFHTTICYNIYDVCGINLHTYVQTPNMQTLYPLQRLFQYLHYIPTTCMGQYY